MNWYYEQNEKQNGPVPEWELRELHENGVVAPRISSGARG